MLAEDLLKEGRLDDALSALQDSIRKDASNAKLRVFLFQLLCVRGEWKRALDQLAVASQLDAKNLLMAQICQPAIMCEMLRTDVFAGRRSPMILGEPEPWIASMVQAAGLSAQGEHSAAADLRAGALESAPASGGFIDGKPFEWIMDADARLGPMLELIMDGKYYWAPWSRIRSITLETPADLRDMVWSHAMVTLATGAVQPGMIPVRYPGSESSGDSSIRLSRRTEFSEPVEGSPIGLGQRLLATDAEDFPLLGVKQITITPTGGESAMEDGSGSTSEGSGG